MEPAHPQFSEDVIKVKIFRRSFGDGRVGAVRASYRTADAVSPLGKIDAVSADSSDAVGLHPFDQGGIDSALEDKIFHQHADLIVGKCGDDGGFHTKASAQAADHIVFSAAFPGTKLPCRTDTALSRVQTKHHFTQRHGIKGTFTGWFQIQVHNGSPFQDIRIYEYISVFRIMFIIT